MTGARGVGFHQIKTGRRQPTKRQLEILALMAEGATYLQAGRTLGISQKTVQSHLCDFYQRTESVNIANAIAYAIREGLIK